MMKNTYLILNYVRPELILVVKKLGNILTDIA